MNAHRFSDAQLQDARTRWDIIAADVQMKRRGRELAGCCPFHSERTPSFYVSPDKGFFHCFGCGAHGTVVDYVMRVRGLDFVDAVTEILGLPQRPPKEAAATLPPVRQSEPDRDVKAQIDRIIAECQPIGPTTAAHLYLYLRGLSTLQPELLAHPGLLYAEDVGGPGAETPPWRRWYSRRAKAWFRGAEFPALVAPIRDRDRVVTAIQRIWLVGRVEFEGGRGPGDNRAPLQVRKKTLGHMGDGAVRLREPGAILGLAEGVETAIAAADEHGVPVWAVCGVHRLGFPAHWRAAAPPGEAPEIWIAPMRPPVGTEAHWIDERPPAIWIPPYVERLIVFGDNGDIGRVIAEFAAAWYAKELGINAQAMFPREPFGDFNDQRLALAS